MKFIKILSIIALIYIAIVVLFESMLGYFQPANQSTLVISTSSESGELNERVLARLESNGMLYVAANHWPRSWYRQALANPQVSATVDGQVGSYLAVRIEGAEHDRVDADNSLGLGFRFLTGFPPRYFVRLDPR